MSFSQEALVNIDWNRIPQHIAFVMDGNRRWSRQCGENTVVGYWKGAEALIPLIRAAVQLRIKTLTMYSFSTENWARPREEVDALMGIFEHYLTTQCDAMVQEGVRLGVIGDISKFPRHLQEAVEEALQRTSQGNRVNLVLALNYGGRDEIRRAVQKILAQKKITPEELTEGLIAEHLDTREWGDPDLLIRTSGEMRVSNFLLWQISYAEFYVTEVLWPDFTPDELLRAVLVYQHRQKRMGGGL